jgi:hypothetical protein
MQGVLRGWNSPEFKGEGAERGYVKACNNPEFQRKFGRSIGGRS